MDTDNDPFKARLDKRAEERNAAQYREDAERKQRNNCAVQRMQLISDALARNECDEFSVTLSMKRGDSYEILMKHCGSIIGSWIEQKDRSYVFFPNQQTGSISIPYTFASKHLYQSQDFVESAADVVDYVRTHHT